MRILMAVVRPIPLLGLRPGETVAFEPGGEVHVVGRAVSLGYRGQGPPPRTAARNS